MHRLRPTRAVIDLDALGRNFQRLKNRLTAGCEVMPVVKADAYGHGAEPVARRLEEEGARSLAVAVVEEGMELRRGGVGCEILVMGWIGAGQYCELVRFGLIGNIHTFEMLDGLSGFALGHGIQLPVHIKLDSGMTRLGFRPEVLSSLIEKLRSTSRQLRVEGIFQNFASADSEDPEPALSQIRCFAEMVKALSDAGIGPGIVHVSNSAGTLRTPEWPAGLPLPGRVRPGLILYSRFAGLSNGNLEDVMSLTTVVDQVKQVPAGTRVGYGGTFVTDRPATLGILPVGYADGYPRSLSNRGCVLVRGQRCPIVGRISMDLTAVDLTGLPTPPLPGEPALLFGTQEGVRLGVDELADAAGTVSWEILCGVGPRVPRVIMENGIASRVISRFYPDGEISFDGDL